MDKDIEMLDEDNDDDVDDDDSMTKDKDIPQYVTKAKGKPVPVQLQNPKRFYCECGRSYSRASDLKRHQLQQCGKECKYPWVCPKCPSNFMRHQSHREHVYKIHWKREPYQCEVCDMKFFHGPNYTAHKSLHPEHTFSKKVWNDDL